MSTWHIDPVHTEIGFKVKHLMVSTVRGKFEIFEGTLTAADDKLTDAHVTFSADVTSINTGNTQRDGHLRSGDFFAPEQFPKITFVSKRFESAGGTAYKVTGDLTIRGVTKEVTLDATYNGLGVNMGGKRIMSFDIGGAINRMDFGVAWNAPLETGGVVLGETVWFDISAELIEE